MAEFIAEVSSNHAQDLDRCLAFVDAAAAIGCDAVKFQLFRVRRLFSPEALAARPELLRREAWELPLEFLKPIASRCAERQISFGCTPFDLDAVGDLEPYVAFYKVASYELLWDELLAACARTGKRIILSTGMATMDEVAHAVAVLRENGCASPELLHCTSAYPTPHTEANLAAIESLRRSTGCPVGWSDHTVRPGVIHRAIHRWGAGVIEFHLDLEGLGDEFGSGHCWLPGQIGRVIHEVRTGLEADGNGDKVPSPSEQPDRMWRADPSDGLRPLLATRAGLHSAD
jgi:N-acetylneuraminate synthase